MLAAGKGVTSQRRKTPEGPLLRLRKHDNSPASYGAIRFAGSKRMPSKWASVSVTSDVDDIVDLLGSTWDLGRPPVIISVTGAAATEINFRAKERAIFERGLRHAALKTGAWIITGGTNTGVMKLVGSMVQKCGDDAPVCVGIVPQGIVLNHEEMLRAGRGQIYHYPKVDNQRTDRASLDFNHTHFLLVDDGTVGQYGGEIHSRSAIEDTICKSIDNDVLMDEVLPTPMVLIVVSGGPGTLDTIITTLEKERPVIVLADSGGIATQIYRYVVKGELPPLSTKLKNGEPENKKDLETLKAKLPIVKRLGESLKGANKVKQLSFFHTSNIEDGDAHDFETEILEAILSDCDTTEDAIMHAVKWSEPDIIETQLQISRQIDQEGLVRAFQSALINTESKSARLVVQTLLDYKASSRLVRLNRLFDTTRTPACPDPYDMIKNWKRAKRKSKKGGLLARRRVNPLVGGAPAAAGAGGYVDDEVDGFQLLAEELEEMGYRKNLAFRKLMADHAAKQGRVAIPRRTRLDNYVPPSFMDLMMWAVVVGQPELARLLWARTRNPMRTALMAARFSAKIQARLGPDHLDTDKITANTLLYESWASGVLDEVQDLREATALLTLVPRKRNPKDGQTLHLWEDSVMDQACNDDHPCKNFVARSNCQDLLTNYFHGNYSGSKARITRDTKDVVLWAQVAINVLAGLTGYVLSPVLPLFVRCQAVYVDAANEDDDDDDDDDGDDDQWEDSYFSKGKTATAEATGLMSSLRGVLHDTAVQRWYFWDVPRVKFYAHTFTYMAYIVTFVAVICGPGLGMFGNPWNWAYREGLMDANLPIRLDEKVVLEGVLWLYALGRIVEEVEQVYRAGKLSAYFSDVWNRLDALSLLLLLITFALRIVIWIDIMPFAGIGDAGGNSVMLNVMPSTLQLTHDVRQYLMQLIQICFSLSAFFVLLRFIDTMSIYPHFGMIVTIVGEMVADSKHIYLFLLWLSLASSVLFAGLLPGGQLATDYFMRPFYFPVRAIVGDFDLQYVYDLLGDMGSPYQNLMAFVAVPMLFFYVFFTTITIVNLLIAQMTQAYERIEQRAAVFRRYQKVELIREYKDKRSPVPPPFIILRSALLLLYSCCRRPLGSGSDDEESENETGFSDYMPYSRTEELLKREREHQQHFLKKLTEESVTAQRMENLGNDLDQLKEDMEREHESVAGRFDRLEDRLAKILALMHQKAKEDMAADANPTRPAFVPPAKLQPINYVSEGTAVAKGESLPPVSAKGRHDPLQPPPAPPYAGGGGKMGYYGAKPGSALAAVRESQAYLTSLASLPLGGHRSAPRLSQPRTEGAAQTDLQMLDSARRVFSAYDRDASGDIDARELQPALRDLGLVNVDSAQTQAILSRYDANDNAKLDFVEFTQLLHELREFQGASGRAERDAAMRPPAAVRAAAGGIGSYGYYSPEQIQTLQRQAAQAERDRMEEGARLRSLDAGPPP